MREDKTKFTVKYYKTDNKVFGYYPNDMDYPNESFEEDATFGYIEIAKSEWENRAKKAIVNGNSIEAYVKPDSELLQEAKHSKKLEINKARDEAIYSNITITTENSGSQTFSCFKNISGELNLAITALQNRIDNGETDPTIRFPEVNNSIINMTINDYKAIQNELGLRADYYAQGRELKDSVEACTTIEEVDAINIVFN
jgi:hypothetical protein